MILTTRILSLLLVLTLHYCPGHTACYNDEFVCQVGSCIAQSRVCDGRPNCGVYGDDEWNCRTINPERTDGNCNDDEFLCNSGECLGQSRRCLGAYGCRHRDNNGNCIKSSAGRPGECQYNDFRCNNGMCIPLSQQCNGTPDCLDGEDELTCMVQVPART